jgi:hypothetical protein
MMVRNPRLLVPSVYYLPVRFCSYYTPPNWC